MTIKVTQQDIDSGEQEDCNTCPIALAVRRKGGLFTHAEIYTDEIICRFPDKTFSWSLPKTAGEFIQLFDDFGVEAVEPFEFEVNVLALI